MKSENPESGLSASPMGQPQTGSYDPVALGLPHRPPFLFVDEVTELRPGEYARGVKTFPAADPMFAGHFPGQPLVPGVILTEALAQLAGISAAQAGRRFLLSAIRQMKFPGGCLPEERLDLFARKTGAMGGLWMFEVRATVGERVVAEGQVVLNEVITPPVG